MLGSYPCLFGRIPALKPPRSSVELIVGVHLMTTITELSLRQGVPGRTAGKPAVEVLQRLHCYPPCPRREKAATRETGRGSRLSAGGARMPMRGGDRAAKTPSCDPTAASHLRLGPPRALRRDEAWSTPAGAQSVVGRRLRVGAARAGRERVRRPPPQQRAAGGGALRGAR